MRKISGVFLVVVLCVDAASSAAYAFDPLSVYVGAGVGESNVKSNESVYANAVNLSKHHSAWKILAGIRPISIVGAEFEYIDFGRVQGTTTTTGGTLVFSDVYPKAEALFGLLYLPLPLPVLNVYGKAGLAHLQNTVNASTTYCPKGSYCPQIAPYRNNHRDNRFAYGAGVQAKFLGVTARLEYERINANTGDPDLFSLGVNWTF